MLPVIDIVSVPDKGTDGQLSRCPRFLFQLETHFLRQTIPFQAIDPLVRQDAVLPGSQPTTRSRYDMINIAFVRSKFLAGVLAVSTVPFPDSLSRELGSALRHLVVTGQNQDCRDPNQAADRSDREIFFPNRKADPILPSDRAHIAGAKHIEGSRVAVCHHAKGLGRRLHIDRLPISIQNKNRCFIQDVIHTVF